MSIESSSLCDVYHHSVTLLVGIVGGILLADRRMWAQYVADVGSATAEQVEAASVRTSRRMSTILVLENENGHAAAVLPEEEKKRRRRVLDQQRQKMTTWVMSLARTREDPPLPTHCRAG